MGYGRGGGGRKEYDNANRISMWENDRAREGKRDPELKGSATEVECPCCGEKTDYWVSMWENQNNGSGSRAPVLSGKIEPKEADTRSSGRSNNRRDEPEPRRYGGGGRSNDRDEPRSSRRDDDDEPRRSRNATVDPLDDDLSDLPF